MCVCAHSEVEPIWQGGNVVIIAAHCIIRRVGKTCGILYNSLCHFMLLPLCSVLLYIAFENDSSLVAVVVIIIFALSPLSVGVVRSYRVWTNLVGFFFRQANTDSLL